MCSTPSLAFKRNSKLGISSEFHQKCGSIEFIAFVIEDSFAFLLNPYWISVYFSRTICFKICSFERTKCSHVQHEYDKLINVQFNANAIFKIKAQLIEFVLLLISAFDGYEYGAFEYAFIRLITMLAEMGVFAVGNFRHFSTIYVLRDYACGAFEPPGYRTSPICATVLNMVFCKSVTVMNQINAAANFFKFWTFFKSCNLNERI